MRVPRVASRFPFAVCFFMFICSAVVVRSQSATTTVTSLTLSTTSATSIPLQSYAAISGMGLQTDSSGNPLDLGYVQNNASYVIYQLTVPQADNYAVTLNYSSPGGFPWGNTGVNFF